MQGERPRGGWAATTRALADSTSPWLGPIGREGVRCPRPAPPHRRPTRACEMIGAMRGELLLVHGVMADARLGR